MPNLCQLLFLVTVVLFRTNRAIGTRIEIVGVIPTTNRGPHGLQFVSHTTIFRGIEVNGFFFVAKGKFGHFLNSCSELPKIIAYAGFMSTGNLEQSRAQIRSRVCKGILLGGGGIPHKVR